MEHWLRLVDIRGAGVDGWCPRSKVDRASHRGALAIWCHLFCHSLITRDHQFHLFSDFCSMTISHSLCILSSKTCTHTTWFTEPWGPSCIVSFAWTASKIWILCTCMMKLCEISSNFRSVWATFDKLWLNCMAQNSQEVFSDLLWSGIVSYRVLRRTGGYVFVDMSWTVKPRSWRDADEGVGLVASQCRL